MSIVTQVSKGEIWTLLGDRAMEFARWLNDTNNTNSMAVRTILESVDVIDLEHPLFNSIVDILLAELVITSTETANITARIAELTTPPAFGT